MNLDHGGAGAGVIDVAGVDAAVMRCQHSAFGDDAFPTLWLKAGALLHGLASTQYFIDGNKRTAWAAAETFLLANGIDLGPIDDVQSDVFTRAIATDSNLGVETAAEWFEVTHTRRRAGPATDPRLEYLFLAQNIEQDEEGINYIGTHVTGIGVPVMPAISGLVVITLVHWREGDLGREHLFTAGIVQGADAVLDRIDEPGHWLAGLETPVGGARDLWLGIRPTLIAIPILFNVLREGPAQIAVYLDGEEVGLIRVLTRQVSREFDIVLES